MQNAYLYTLASVAAVSIASFAGALVLAIRREKLERITTFLVALSAGTLLGDAFLHLLPEVMSENGSLSSWTWVIGGILIFFVLEKIVCWRHCHIATSDEHPHPVGAMNLVGDALHNFIDGAVIAGTFMASIPLGLATTMAVIAHEIPQEISDFGVLLHAGYSRKRALFFNFTAALVAFAGAITALIAGSQSDKIIDFILPFTAGGFIYIASADLIPELHKETMPSKSLSQLIYILIGIGIMGLLKFIE